MKNPKIAYLLPNAGISGGVGVVLQHTNRLLKRGYDVMIGTQDGSLEADWFPNQSVPLIPAEQLPDDLDILVATSWSTTFQTVQINAKHKCYFVQSDETRFHEYGNDFYHITRLSYLMNFHYLTEARWIQQWLLDNFDKKAMLIPNGLDKDIFHPMSPLAEKNSKFRILLEGSIGLPYKGMKEAFEVVRGLDAEVWCVSSFGKPEPSWKCDKFFEQVPITKMSEIYSSCDILLKLSRVEGFFGPPLEMMACGGTCVVGKVTGYDEYIEDGVNALVVNPNDIQGARLAVQQLMDDENLRKRLQKNGQETARQWRWETSIDKLEEYFKDIIGGRHGLINDAREQTNQSISFFYKKTISQSFSPRVIAHKIGNKTRNKFLKNLLRKIYLRLKTIPNL